MRPWILYPLAGACAATALVACGGGDDDKGLPQLGQAQPGTLSDCAGLAARLNSSDTTFTSV